MSTRTALINACRRQPLQWLAAAGVIIIAPLFFIGGPDWSSTPLDRALWDLGHLIFFALATYAAQPWRRLQGWQLWAVSTLVVLAIGIGIELLQSGLDRQEDWRDVLRNQVGTWLVLAWRPIFSSTSATSRQHWALAGASLLLIAIELGTVGVVAARHIEMNRQMPQLYSFEHNQPNQFWRGPVSPSPLHRPENHPAGGQSLEISLNTRVYSGASLDNLPADWRGYSRLNLALFNPHDDRFTMTLRINDVAHERHSNAYNDRFNTQLVLEPGPNRFTFDLERVRNAPRTRSMDMDNIRRLSIFVIRLPQPRTVYLTELRLD
ncbi:succinyl-CoA synthetase subunit beta [Marinobacter sp.]|uniref:succinyl-CoA synthetase subunit beta n=1 Tax=Marinobacter sp. TaxID=50741 RepID=UPI0034A14921